MTLQHSSGGGGQSRRKPVAAPALVRTIEVLAAVAAWLEVAFKFETLLAMEVTDPKK